MEEPTQPVDLEWEEWDGKSPFLHHCIAGSIAGVAEHTLLYPLDTIKTHMQAYCPVCPDKALCSGSSATAPARLTAQPTSNKRLHPSLPTSRSSSLGMWSTMRNIIQYGYSSPTTSSSSSSTSSSLLKATRQTGTLTAYHPSPPPASLSSTIASSTTTRGGRRGGGGGYIRLWRGVQTVAIGCIPAHALYFSTYEHIKALFTTLEPQTDGDANGNSGTMTNTYLGPVGASIAGAASTFSHDLIMTPLDTIKQRMQLGHYDGMGHAFAVICRNEGWSGLYRSFGVTLLTNLPYGMVMVSTNEFLRSVLSECQPQHQQSKRLDLSTTLLSGCGAGLVAAGVTTPLDRIKTRLQTQTLGTTVPRVAQTCPKAAAALSQRLGLATPEYSGFGDALGSIVREEGVGGLWRGLVPRVLTHAPAVAISWTSYEAAKKWLAVDLDV